MLKLIKKLPENLRARDVALRWLAEVALHDETLDSGAAQLEGLDALSPQDRAFARRLVTSTLRHDKPFRALLRPFLRKSIPEHKAPVYLILLMGMAQLLREDIPPHAAVNTSVELCKLHGFDRMSGLVNVVLKKIAAQREELNAKLDAMAPKEWLPSWLFDDWRAAYGKDAVKGMVAQLRKNPPLDVSVKDDATRWAETLGGEVVGAQSVRLAAGGAAVSQLEGYEDGAWWVQDVAASLPAQLLLAQLDDGEGKQIYDFCAAPGGKTMQLAAAGARVTAVDLSDHRLARVEENLERTQLGEKVELVRADLREWQPQEGAVPDAILFDAPCSATGTFRRHPDLLLNKRPKDVKEMVALQRELLSQLMRWLPAGVPVLYCVCSLQHAEGEAQIEWLQEAFEGVKMIPLAAPEGMPQEFVSEQGAIRTLPHHLAEKGGMDGFFMAMFEKA